MKRCPSPGGRRPANGPQTAIVAAFRSGITEAISAAVGFPVAVLAATEDPSRHALRLTAARHAAWLASGGTSPFRWGPHRRKDAAYTMMRMDAGEAIPSLPAGLALVEGALAVRLPAGSTLGQFDELLALALHDVRLDVLARDPAEVLRRHRSGLTANVDPRYTRRPGVCRPAFALVGDLYRFRVGDVADVLASVALALSGLSVRAELTVGGRRSSRGEGR